MDSGGKLTPCLTLHVKGLGTDVLMHPWDLSASASLSSLAIVEKIHGTGGGPLYLVQTPVGAELLSVKFVMVKYLSCEVYCMYLRPSFDQYALRAALAIGGR